jgi:hypothetical protein
MDKIWLVFLISGIGFCLASLFSGSDILSAAFAVLGISSLWSIGESKEQTKRVEKGWFPKNPKHEK